MYNFSVDLNGCFNLTLGDDFSVYQNAGWTPAAGAGTSRRVPAVPEPPASLVVATLALLVAIFAVGTVGNLLVILVVWRNQDMRNSTNYFLMNLSVADLLVIVLCMPPAFVDILAKEQWHFGPIMCKVVPFLEYAVSVASVLTILAITIDRYYAICHPLKAQYTCTFERMLKTVCIVWTIAAIASSPLVAIAQFRDSRFVDGTPIKVCRQPIRTHPAKAYVISVVVIFFFIPFMVVTLFYSFISRRFTDDKNAVGMNNGMGMTQQRYAARRQVTTMLFTMVFVFFLCLIPGRAIVLWMTFATPSQLVNIGFEGYLCLTYFPRVLHFTNSAVNPIIYSLISTKFSLAFRRIFSSGNRDLQRLRRNWISWRRSPFTDDSFKLFVCNSLKCKTSHV